MMDKPKKQSDPPKRESPPKKVKRILPRKKGGTPVKNCHY